MPDATVTAIHVKNYCGARTKQREGTCEQPAGWGTPHPGVGRCRFHGGSSPNAVKAGAVALVERDVRELFGKIAPEIVPVDNPLAAYAELAGRVLAWMQLMDDLLGELRQPGYMHRKAGEQIEAKVQLYERAMDRANVVLGSYARLRIDERLAEITEKQKLTVIRAIEAGLDEAGISDEARADARRRVARHLRLVSAEAA